jgi:hypothetical protein
MQTMPTPIEVPNGIVLRGVPISPSTYLGLADFNDKY